MSTNSYMCGLCFQSFSQAGTLNRHRERCHSKNHLCLLCVPGEETPIIGTKIGEHLKKCHGVIGAHTCQCCYYLFGRQSELNKHKRYMERFGKPGQDEEILAKSRFQPGTLSQEHVRKVVAQADLEEGAVPNALPVEEPEAAPEAAPEAPEAQEASTSSEASPSPPVATEGQSPEASKNQLAQILQVLPTLIATPEQFYSTSVFKYFYSLAAHFGIPALVPVEAPAAIPETTQPTVGVKRSATLNEDEENVEPVAKWPRWDWTEEKIDIVN